jgi:protein-S-isoprenylcysteine O-methyltransferase Ste14
MGKIAYLGSALFIIAKDRVTASLLYDGALTGTAGIVLYAAGLMMLLVALAQLGRSTAVGIPERKTELRTHGIYGFTRNPVYVGAFMMCGGSCLFAMHPVNLLLAAVALFIHLRIVRKEEEFLEQRFGPDWQAYKARVPRYLGIPRTARDGD